MYRHGYNQKKHYSNGLFMGVIPITYKSWDDPPSIGCTPEKRTAWTSQESPNPIVEVRREDHSLLPFPSFPSGPSVRFFGSGSLPKKVETCSRILGGGFKYFLFSPTLGEDSHFGEYFSNWLKPPISVCHHCFFN